MSLMQECTKYNIAVRIPYLNSRKIYLLDIHSLFLGVSFSHYKGNDLELQKLLRLSRGLISDFFLPSCIIQLEFCSLIAVLHFNAINTNKTTLGTVTSTDDSKTTVLHFLVWDHDGYTNHIFPNDICVTCRSYCVKKTRKVAIQLMRFFLLIPCKDNSKKNHFICFSNFLN